MEWPVTGYLRDAAGIKYYPVPVEEPRERSKNDHFTYIPRHDGDPHPPIIPQEHPMNALFPMPDRAQNAYGYGHRFTTAIMLVPEHAYKQPQYPAGYQYGYQYPYITSAPPMPVGTRVYEPHDAPQNPYQPHYPGHGHERSKRHSKERRRRSTKPPDNMQPGGFPNAGWGGGNVWYGRTAEEVYADEIEMAGKEGGYGSREIAPRDPKPSDRFWVMPYEPGERPMLLTHYAIMEMQKPGHWQLGADGYLRWQKERPKKEKKEESESSASSWEN